MKKKKELQFTRLFYSVISQRARKFKKVQAKKLMKSNKSKKILHEIAFLAVLNFFPVQKLFLVIFEIPKMEFGQKNSSN